MSESEQMAGFIGSVVGFLINLTIQILIYRWISIKFICKGNKEEFEKHKHTYYPIFAVIALLVYFLIRKI